MPEIGNGITPNYNPFAGVHLFLRGVVIRSRPGDASTTLLKQELSHTQILSHALIADISGKKAASGMNTITI